MATAPTTQNDLTRQQLDELDALLQRMLTLPINPPDASAPAAPVSTFAPPLPPPLPPAPVIFPATLPFPDVGLSQTVQPPVEPAPPVLNRRVDPPSPAPAPHRYAPPVSTPAPTEVPRLLPEPEPTPIPLQMPVPVAKKTPAFTAPLELSKLAVEERPASVVVKPRQTAVLTPAAPSVPVVPAPVAAPADVPVALPLVPFVALNRGLNGVLGLFGFPGRVLRSGFVKNLFGLAGLGLLAYTAAKVAQIHGWISLPVQLPWPR